MLCSCLKWDDIEAVDFPFSVYRGEIGHNGDGFALVNNEVPGHVFLHKVNAADGKWPAVEAKFVVKHHFNGHFAGEVEGVAAHLPPREGFCLFFKSFFLHAHFRFIDSL